MLPTDAWISLAVTLAVFVALQWRRGAPTDLLFLGMSFGTFGSGRSDFRINRDQRLIEQWERFALRQLRRSISSRVDGDIEILDFEKRREK